MTALGRALRAVRWALLLAVCLPAPLHAAPRAVWTVEARITAYTEAGYAADGTWTTAGVTAACSYDIPLGATVVLPNGDAYVCHDRGDLGDGYPTSWIDVFTPPPWQWVSAVYGDWATVTVEAE